MKQRSGWRKKRSNRGRGRGVERSEHDTEELQWRSRQRIWSTREIFSPTSARHELGFVERWKENSNIHVGL